MDSVDSMEKLRTEHPILYAVAVFTAGAVAISIAWPKYLWEKLKRIRRK